ncbi:hypothetical protein HMPREF2534_01615 [Bacteroides thetaiotaomicron]|nr:hypothetical protein HMPREF2534_01615 [Bacteroides thetaiotaomicron]
MTAGRDSIVTAHFVVTMPSRFAVISCYYHILLLGMINQRIA